MMRRKILSRLFYVFTLLLLGVVGCVSDKLDTPVPGQGEVVTIEMTIPGYEVPQTRSIEGTKGEAVVQKIDILFFDKSTPAAELVRGVKVTGFTQETSGTDYKVKYKLELSKHDDIGSMVIIANASDEVDAVLAANPSGTEKQTILEALKFTTSRDKDNGYKWNISTPGYTPIPMYGETAIDGVAPGSTVGVALARMLARIDVENKVNGSVFKLEAIYLVNYNTSGYIAPAWNTSNGNMIQDPYSNNENPMIPDPAGKQPGTQAAAMEYEYKQGSNEVGQLLTGEIYTYEALKTTDDKLATSVCLIIKGKYLGTDYYYRVDFTKKTEGAATASYMPLYRNHKYIVTITSAEGIGYDTFDKALQAPSVLSNLKTSILVVDMAGINHIVYDGQFFMGVESRLIDMPYGVNRQLKHRVSSDYHGDWKAEVLDPGTNSWLRFAGNVSTVNGTDINQTGVEFAITSVTPPGGSNKYVNGKIVFTAGRLRDTLTVRRVPIAEMFARSNVVSRSGILTFAVVDEDHIPAWSQGVLFKWGSLVAMASAGNPYAPSAHVVYCPPGVNTSGWKNGLEGWDMIPYAHPNFGFTTTSRTGDDVDAFKDQPNNTGFDESAGIGDICRYISSGTGGKGWVEGKWRLPTYAELKQLHDETATKTVHMGNFLNMMKVLDANPGNYMNGSFNPESGWFLGANVTGATATESNMATPPGGTVFLPAAGQRYPNGDGNVVHTGAYGYYWSSTPYTVDSRYTVNYLFVDKDGIVFYDADRSYAFPIRCIKDY